MNTQAPGLFNNLNINSVRASRQNSVDESFEKVMQQALTEKDDKKLHQACQDMEALFVYKMLQQMRATIPDGGYLTAGSAEKIYRDMLDEEYSKVIAGSRSSFGLAEMLYQQLKRDI